MVSLIAKGKALNITETLVGLFCRSSDTDLCYITNREIDFLTDPNSIVCTLVESKSTAKSFTKQSPVVYDIPSLDHLKDGDIIAINASGLINTIFRIGSYHNAMFITDRCNSNCLMCSQPPKNTDDLDYYFAINKSLIGLMPKETEVIGITGGEPTILGDRLLELLELLNLLHPETTVHMLSNGRAFALKNYTQKISLTNNNLIIGIPLYSDNYLDHDFIVQAKDAFNQSIIGIHNLARFNVKIEIRIVLHKLTYERLPQIAKFIYKNFPFVEHIAFMGLEYVGYTPFNHDKLWIEPSRYMLKLEEATLFLDQMGMNISIYNLQHCLLKETLWKFSKKSISDWKRNYIDECTKCKKLEDCGGVFATSKVHSNEIKAIAQ